MADSNKQPENCKNRKAGDQDGSVLLATLNSGEDHANMWSFIYTENSEESLVAIQNYYERLPLKVWFFFLEPDENYPDNSGVLQAKPTPERFIIEDPSNSNVRFLDGIRNEDTGQYEYWKIGAEYQKICSKDGAALIAVFGYINGPNLHEAVEKLP